MNTRTYTPRFGAGYMREVQQLIARGGNSSRAALIDMAEGKCLAVGREDAIGNSILATFGTLLFAPQRVPRADVERLRERLDESGGIAMIAVTMRDCDLFVAHLPSFSRVLCLTVRYQQGNSSHAVVRGRVVRSKLDPGASGKTVATKAKWRDTNSYSIWKSLLGGIALRFGRAAPEKASAVGGMLRGLLESDESVLSGDLFDVERGTCVDYYHRARNAQIDAAAAVQAFRSVFSGVPDIPGLLQALGFGAARFGKVHVQVGNADFYWLAVPYFPLLRMPFGQDVLLVHQKEPRPVPALDWAAVDRAGLNMLRMRIGGLLDNGMKTTIDPFPETQVEFQALLDELGQLPADDLEDRLDIAGFLPKPRTFDDVTQRCQECIYYLPHRQWCDLPELPLPVKPEWWCRLWKL